MSALLRFEENLPGDSPQIVQAFVAYVSRAIPVARWFERHGIPITWENMLDPEFLQTQVFHHGGRHSLVLSLIARPLRDAFKVIAKEDMDECMPLSENAALNFGFISMNIAAQVRNDDCW